MRLGRVRGRLTLTQPWRSLRGGRFLIVDVQDRFSLAGEARQTGECVVVYDHLGATDGDLIAFAESREATNPFYPETLVPIDAYNAAIIDTLNVDR
jgi:microcompartment protein CcmK/EutM